MSISPRATETSSLGGGRVQTLTWSISEDSVVFTVICSFVVHLFLHDYAFLFSLTDKLTGSTALGAAVFASVLLASRLPHAQLVVRPRRTHLDAWSWAGGRVQPGNPSISLPLALLRPLPHINLTRISHPRTVLPGVVRVGDVPPLPVPTTPRAAHVRHCTCVPVSRLACHRHRAPAAAVTAPHVTVRHVHRVRGVRMPLLPSPHPEVQDAYQRVRRHPTARERMGSIYLEDTLTTHLRTPGSVCFPAGTNRNQYGIKRACWLARRFPVACAPHAHRPHNPP